MSQFPEVFAGAFRVIPTYILEQIDRVLDAEIEKVPAAAPDREFLKDQLLDHVDQYGVIPEFTLVRQEPKDNG